MTTTSPNGERRRGHAAPRARHWAVGVSAGATAVLTGLIAVSAAQSDPGTLTADPTTPVTTTPPSSRAPATTSAPKKKAPSTVAPSTVPAAPRATTPKPAPVQRQPVTRSRGSG